MAATTGKAGLGALLQMSDMAGTPVWATVANVANVNGPSEGYDFLDGTHLASPDNFEEVIPGLRRGGEVTLTCHFDPTNATHDAATGLKSAADAQELTDFRIDLSAIWATNNLIAFSAYVSLGPINISPTEIITRDVTLRVSGPVTWSTKT